MQPSETTPTNPPQQAPGQFDFMLKEQPKPKRNPLQMFRSVPKTAKIILTVILGIFIFVTLPALIFGGSGGKNEKVIDVIARAQEINRVSTLIHQTQNSSASAKNLASSVSAVMTSQQTELTTYLKDNGTKISKSKLNSRLNKSSDSQLQNASQSNNLDSFFALYLKNQLNDYQSSLQAAHKSAGGQAKAILSNDFDSIQALQKAPQLAAIN